MQNFNNVKDFTTYLSTAPVISIIWLILSSSLIIEINRFFPDSLIF
jgi:photosystem I subunit 9